MSNHDDPEEVRSFRSFMLRCLDNKSGDLREKAEKTESKVDSMGNTILMLQKENEQLKTQLAELRVKIDDLAKNADEKYTTKVDFENKYTYQEIQFKKGQDAQDREISDIKDEVGRITAELTQLKEGNNASKLQAKEQAKQLVLLTEKSDSKATQDWVSARLEEQWKKTVKELEVMMRKYRQEGRSSTKAASPASKSVNLGGSVGHRSMADRCLACDQPINSLRGPKTAAHAHSLASSSQLTQSGGGERDPEHFYLGLGNRPGTGELRVVQGEEYHLYGQGGVPFRGRKDDQYELLDRGDNKPQRWNSVAPLEIRHNAGSNV